jgi:WD40 repeat protein
MSPDGSALAVGVEGDVMLVDPATLESVRRWPAHDRKVRQLAFSPDGRWLASAGFDRMVGLSDVATGALVRTMEGHRGRVWSVDFSPDGQLLASGSSDRTVRLWTPDGALLAELTGHTAPVRSVAFSPDGTLLASGDENHEIRLWSVPEGRSQHRLLGHTGKVRVLAFELAPPGGADSRAGLISASSDGSLRLWNTLDGAAIRVLQAHGEERTGKVRAIAFDPDHKLMVTGSQDHTARVWAGDQWRPAGVLHGHLDVLTGVSVSADCQFVFTCSGDRTLRRWSVRAHCR